MRLQFLRFRLLRPLFTRLWLVRSVFVRSLFSRSAPGSSAGSRRRGVRRRQVFSAQFGGSGSAASYSSLLGFSGLESRAMLAADEIDVSYVGNRVVLTLESAGAEITDLNTSYSAATGILTITAA